jgi:hypothetical protein
MYRLVPFLLALLPALAAAPLPRGGRPEFGINGVLSCADLEKVRFDSQPVKEGPRDKVADLVQEAEQAGAPKNRFDVAVHMPWTRFLEGEPIPAYLVMRNNRGAVLGLTSRIDFTEALPEIHGGAARFDIRDAVTGKSVLEGLGHSTNCGGGSLVDVPANGYYVARTDLSRASGQLLPPGEYEVDWEYHPLRSAPVRFTIEKSGTPRPFAAKHSGHRYFHLTSPMKEADRPGEAGDPFHWSDCHLDHVPAASMAAALAVGQHGVYVPDPRTLPARDDLITAALEWRHYRDADRVIVTLRSARSDRPIRFASLPQLVLHVEGTDLDPAYWRHDTENSLESARDGTLLKTPLTIEAKLPADWRERAGVSGTARVAVLIAAERVELPRGPGQRLERLEKVREVRAADSPATWSGIVRTEAIELQFPPRR